jgi:putative transposase
LCMRKSERILWMFSFLEAGHNGRLRKEDTLVRQDNGWRVACRGEKAVESAKGSLDEVLREGARRMLQEAIEVEVADDVDQHQGERASDSGQRLVVRNGSLPAREILSSLGPIRIEQPRVRDRREGMKFTSAILPPYLRRAPSLEALIPTLYLKGISTKDFPEALSAILGEGAKGLAASPIVRLKESWEREYEAWQSRDLKGKRYVYFWADGVYFNVRLSEERPCVLGSACAPLSVIVGALPDGTKELVALVDGERESALSWKALLLDLKRRGLEEGPEVSVGDGALGFWAALEEVFPKSRRQRCWVHKTANVLDKMPKSLQPSAKTMLQQVYLAATKPEALKVYEDFLKLYGAKCPKACQCLEKDQEDLFTFYDFPAEHWGHLRTTNPIESSFATVRHRHRQTKGNGSRLATLTMVHKLAIEAQKHWRKLNGYELLAKVVGGARFEDGVEVAA